MNDFSQRIKDLESKLKKANSRLQTIVQESLKIETKNRQTLQAKEQELENWRKELEISQQERNQIKKEIREKVLELEKSDLENNEKQAKINKILTENSQELEEIDNLLYEERTQYRQIRDKLIAKLCEPCQACEEKTKHIKTLEDRNSNLKIWTFLLLLSGIFNFFLFLYVVFNKKKKKTCCFAVGIGRIN
ncbi:MAG: hypothetical protein I3273_05100 [Candidatus Moeniiplasma glomeromycotorum]|nr:hypothetical protein [Candidatus Moeniiplasma glomeromycotorum]MCE8169470.1 hypothetical protein [Candidatus Moeniiplasma glomeromycotorum]